MAASDSLAALLAFATKSDDGARYQARKRQRADNDNQQHQRRVGLFCHGRVRSGERNGNRLRLRYFIRLRLRGRTDWRADRRRRRRWRICTQLFGPARRNDRTQHIGSGRIAARGIVGVCRIGGVGCCRQLCRSGGLLHIKRRSRRGKFGSGIGDRAWHRRFCLRRNRLGGGERFWLCGLRTAAHPRGDTSNGGWRDVRCGSANGYLGGSDLSARQGIRRLQMLVLQ